MWMKLQTGTQNWLKPPNRQTINKPSILCLGRTLYSACFMCSAIRTTKEQLLPSYIHLLFLGSRSQTYNFCEIDTIRWNVRVLSAVLFIGAFSCKQANILDWRSRAFKKVPSTMRASFFRLTDKNIRKLPRRTKKSFQLTTADLLGPFQQPCPPEYFIRLYLFGSPVHSPQVLKYR